jgi:hypothetical protein
MLSFVSPKQKNSETLTDVLFDSNTTVSKTSNHFNQSSSDLLNIYDWNISPLVSNTLYSTQRTVQEPKQYINGFDTRQYKDLPKQHVDDSKPFVDKANHADNTNYRDKSNYVDNANLTDNANYPDNSNYEDNAHHADNTNHADNTKNSDNTEFSSYPSPIKKMENEAVKINSNPAETVVYTLKENMDNFYTTLKPKTSSNDSNFCETKKGSSVCETENYSHCFNHIAINKNVHGLNPSLLKNSSKINFLPLYVDNQYKTKRSPEEKPMDSLFQKNNYNTTLKTMLEQKLSTHQQESPKNLLKPTDCVKPLLKYKQQNHFIHSGNYENDVYNIQGKGPLSIFVGNIPSTVTPVSPFFFFF